MNQEKKNRNNGVNRFPIINRISTLHIILFDGAVRTDHTVRIVNMSVGGVGIASSEAIEPGLVCFDEQVGGHKFGVVRWSKVGSDGYRGGIVFLTLPLEKERYLLERITESLPNQALQDPENIIATLLDSIRQEMNG